MLFYFIIYFGPMGCSGFAINNLSPTLPLTPQPLPSTPYFSHYQLELNEVPVETKTSELEIAVPGTVEISYSVETEDGMGMDSEPWPEQELSRPSVPMEFLPLSGEEVSLSLTNDLSERPPEKNSGEDLPGSITPHAKNEEDPQDAREILPPSPSPPPLAIFPSMLHEKVENYISFFQIQADSFFARSLGRSTAYADMMKGIFREKGLPEELFYLALIESGFNPTAFSRSKASGIWQFIGKTAKRFGLKVDKWVDERRDPEKSTHAAANYLKSLYGLFNNWDLATASYNAGEGKILKAMQRAKSQDFWKISQQRYLKKETKEYVPMFLAAVTIAQNPRKYGFQNIEYSPPLVYEKVTVPPGTNLLFIAKAAESDLSHIQALNPALKKGKTPPHSSFEVKLPPGKKEVFQNNFLTLRQITVKSKKHRVGKGESLTKIARKYRVTLQALCDMNDLSPKSRIKPGALLLLPIF